jgi:acyl-CoA thioester hydrolase
VTGVDGVSGVFGCEIQPRFRDLNLGNHVDSVEAIRLLDEARIQFFLFAPLDPPAPEGARRRGLLSDVPAEVTELVAAQRVDYRGEMAFVPFRPFLVRLWVTHVGRTSFRVASELRVEPDGAPTVVAESTVALRVRATGAGWAMSDDVRARLEGYRGEAPAFR